MVSRLVLIDVTHILECVVATKFDSVLNADAITLLLVNVVSIHQVTDVAKTRYESNLVRSSELDTRLDANTEFSLVTVYARSLNAEATVDEETNSTSLVESVANIRSNCEVSNGVSSTALVAFESELDSEVNLVAELITNFRSYLEYVVLCNVNTVYVTVCVTEATTDPYLSACCESRYCQNSSQKNLLHNLTFFN